MPFFSLVFFSEFCKRINTSLSEKECFDSYLGILKLNDNGVVPEFVE